MPAIAVAVTAACFVAIGLCTAVYAGLLAATQNGAVESERLDAFAQLAGARVAPALRVLLLLFAARWLAGRGRLDRVGAAALAGGSILIALAIDLAFGDTPGATDVVVAVVTVLATGLGQRLGERDRQRATQRAAMFTDLRRATTFAAVARTLSDHLPPGPGFDLWAGTTTAPAWLAGHAPTPPTIPPTAANWIPCGDDYGLSLRGPSTTGEPVLLAMTDAIAVALARIDQQAAAERTGARRERERLASEIHDTIAQDLAGASTQIEAAAGAITQRGVDADAHLRAAGGSVRSALAELRGLVWALRPPTRRASLATAMQRHLDRLALESGVEVHADVPSQATELTPEAEHCLLRVLQESSRNAVRHAATRRLDVSLDLAGPDVVLTVADDGRGFDVDATTTPDPAGGFGLATMRERVARLGGELTIDSGAGRGTRMRARLPRSAAAEPT